MDVITTTSTEEHYNENGRLSVSNGQLCADACEKIPRTFAHRVPLFSLMMISSLVCPCVGVLVCACIEVWPSHTTSAGPISPLVTSVEASTNALHQPLPASKTILSSWSLVVICPLIAPNATGITGWYDIDGSWYQRYHYMSSRI